MSSENIFHETKCLPSNVLTLVDDMFYEFVEQHLGVYQSLLLKTQQINSVPCFLLINDPCDILNLNINDDDLNILKRKICFILSNGSFIVKPGFKIVLSTTSIPINIAPSSSPCSTPPITTAVTAPQTLTSTPPITTFTSTQQTISSSPSDPILTSTVEHRRYFFNLLKKWCLDHKDEFMSDSFDLQEGKDFILNVLYDQNNDLQASIKCNCNRLIKLPIKQGKIQLCNFQKHLRSTSCSHMRAIVSLNQQQRKVHLQESTNTLSSSTSITLNALSTAGQQCDAPFPVSIGPSSVTNIFAAPTQNALSQKKTRKRNQSLSQSSSHKKKTRT
ncbi:unnamed protein product [Rotaria socialis]|uniref:Uncharacterized protein n=1 Tax=Rotaria socialis TaxID=392032 RepID=A0A821TR17_9BILA|nr:unnamed protein product [Rotaria socialis]CAF4877059.1 unnamed protein product [Rotaria socialis]